ncbi:thermonuclease family protein [Asticcacaulis sp. EMRT-3]|uniref:thermonuclease family protein n=1 Tax=Asticcacaulis sp. EMRT-3 TaxID=3040349 RepID=UPI0024AEFA28|nr:thermonuclease family protein [Asticcacaulis sp. EMRT-3]MDI7774363.1 thermonuclease family protein [Asticcacaulis sp. EMRT-3]
MRRRVRSDGFKCNCNLKLFALWLSLCVTVCGYLTPLPVMAAVGLSGPAYVIDGDTIVIHGRHIRLFGVDAFEHDQTCGRFACGVAATEAMQGLVRGNMVACVRQATDPYGRMVAVCRAGANDLGQVMVHQGLAVAYRAFSTRYLPDENWARVHHAGAWAHGFDSPRTWRETHVK